jgi:aminomuconate-semialdehyde/2-hydroxymuconate-6-semialdehyde dehydrogenase
VKLIQNYIDGRFVSGKQEFADVNPADGTVIAQVTEADKAQVEEAIHAGRRALRGEWARIGVRERAARLHRIADAIEKRSDCFVRAEVADTGKPVSLASKLDVPRAAANFRAFADLVKMSGLESFQTET